MLEIQRYFSSGETIKITGVSYRRLDLWCRSGIIRSSGRAAGGRGRRRLFTFHDLVEIQTLKSLTESGVRLATLRVAIKKLRREIKEERIESLSSVRLVTDGRTIFRYIPKNDHLESLDVYGQFSFAFGLGDEIGTLIEKVGQLDRSSRYQQSKKSVGWD